MAATVVGVDVGSAMLRAVEVDDPTKPTPTVLRAHQLPLPEGSVKRGEVLEVNTVASVLKRLWAAGGFRSKHVALGIGGQSVIVRDLAVPRMPPAQIKESLPFQVQDLLPVPVSEAVLDYYPISEGENETGRIINGLLVAAFKQAVTANVSAFSAAGLTPVAMDLTPFAITRLHAHVAPASGYAIHLNIGANATSMVIALDGTPHFVRIVPMGGDDATRMIMSRLSAPRERAEAWKREVGLVSAGPTEESRRAAEVVHEATSELLTAVRNTLAYFASTRPGIVFEHISVTGGAARMAGFPTALADSTRVPVVAVDPMNAVMLGRGIKSFDDDDGILSYTTAIALATGGAR